ncbi:YggS family pyridoxal phosphate-dependent enzyme [Myxococcota bacterium]|nr:YggS family pyridoxal phosphate-dependent enzyme [Myxococcota bacterium]
MSEFISRNLDTIHAAMVSAAKGASRDVSGITLVAVSKRQKLDSIETASACGQQIFGENYAQELRDKAAQIACPVTWHFIGPLQKNKLKYIVGVSALIHTVSSLEVARLIDERAKGLGIVQSVLIQVKTSPEPSKHGALPEDLGPLLSAVLELPNIKVEGFMTMAPWDPDPEKGRPYYRALRKIKEETEARYTHLAPLALSMGMSDDFPVAISEGATIIRVGTAIFGSREGVG